MSIYVPSRLCSRCRMGSSWRWRRRWCWDWAVTIRGRLPMSESRLEMVNEVNGENVENWLADPDRRLSRLMRGRGRG